MSTNQTTDNGQDTTAPKESIFISKEDRLEATNLHLRVLSLLKDEQIIRIDFQRLEERRKRVQIELESIQEKIEAHLKVLQSKYGIDLTTHEIRESDGMVVQRTDHKNLLERMTQQQ